MTRREYRRRWLILHKRYESKGIRIFRKGIRESLKNIPYDKLEQWNYVAYLNLVSGTDGIFEAYRTLYTTIGIQHGKKIGRSINKEIRQEKNFDPTSFEGSYPDFIRNWLINNGGQRIISVKDELIEYLVKFMADGIEKGKDIRTISRELQKHILSRGFYRWQIERIVRTETTAAANFGAIQAGESSGVIWEKEWISSRDGRTRRRPDDQFDHYDIDGLKVGKGEKFDVQGDLLDYPGDPKGQAGNTINCRCTLAVVAKRDEEGRIIFTNRSFINQ